jgi:hypothetical protein
MAEIQPAVDRAMTEARAAAAGDTKWETLPLLMSSTAFFVDDPDFAEVANWCTGKGIG